MKSANDFTEYPRRWLIIILGLYLSLAIGFGVVNPLFEAPDEIWHYFTAQTIADTARLPQVTADPDLWMSQEAAQPPLYYMVSAILISPMDTSRAKELVWPNPRVQLGDASSPTNINAFVHPPTEAWPWQGYALAAHTVRLFSTFFGLGTLLCIFASGRLIWPKNPERALLATAIVAFLPQYVFLHGSISNDTLIILLSSAALWQLLRLWFGQISRWRLLGLGITLGLAILSKTAGLLLFIYALGFSLVLLYRNQKQKPASAFLKEGLVYFSLIIIPTALIGGWLLWRNWSLYGDPTATNVFVRFAGGDRGYSLAEVLAETSGLWLSFIALFGWANIRPPDWVYYLWDSIYITAAAGAIYSLIAYLRRRNRSSGIKSKPNLIVLVNWSGLPAVLLAFWAILVYAGLVYFMLRTPAAQGRLLFPAILPIALAVSFGLSQFRWRGIYFLVPLLAFFSSLYCVISVIPDAYERLPAIDAAQIPSEANKLLVDLGEDHTLLAAVVENPIVEPGEWVWLTLYWQAGQSTKEPVPEQAPQFVLELFGRENEPIGKLQSYHGGGLYPANFWAPGEVIADRVAVEVSEEALVPTQARVNLMLVKTSPSGGSIPIGPAVDVGHVKVTPAEWPPLSGKRLAQLGGITLAEAELEPVVGVPGERVDVRVTWEVNSPPGRDFTTFVHLGDPSQQPLAQGDSPALGGDYPTRWWTAGEVIEDRYSLTIPADLEAGQYPVQLGLYDPATGERVPLTVDGSRQPNDAYQLGWLTIR